MTDTIVDDIHQAGKKVYVWTLNDISKLSEFVDMGVDGVITDNVESLYNKSELLYREQLQSPKKYLKFLIWKIEISQVSRYLDRE